MQVWLMTGRYDWRALAASPDGSALPRDHGPWSPLGLVDLDELDADESEAADAVRKRGYYIIRVAAPRSRPTVEPERGRVLQFGPVGA